MSEAIAIRAGRPSQETQKLSLPAFAEWARLEQIRFAESTGQVTMSRQVFMSLLRPMLMRLKFDEAYYRRANPDLVQAEAAGIVKSMHEHYLEFGYFESRLPCFVEVEAAFYGKEYPDVAAGILERTVKSAQWHFELFGVKEGRLPRRGWSFSDLMAGN